MSFSISTSASSDTSVLQELCRCGSWLIIREHETGRIVLFANMNEDVAETMSYVVAKRKLSVAYRQGDRVDLLEGKPHLIETLETGTTTEVLHGAGAGGPVEHPERHSDPTTEEASRDRCCCREVDSGAKQGVRHVYRAASPELVGSR